MPAAPAQSSGLERLELRMERLQVTFRFTFAFHAREVRFERDLGSGWERVFPETFSFHASRHDPAELFLQLDDLLRKPRLIGPLAQRRDAQELISRLLAEAPRYLERVCERNEAGGRLDRAARLRFHQDAALLARILIRFLETRDLDGNRPLRMASYVLRRRVYRSLLVLMSERVGADYLARYVRGEVDPFDPADDPSESGFFHVLETGDAEVVNRIVVRMAERAFYLWLDGVCLDEENKAFEKEDSPFADRETEVLAAITQEGCRRIERGRDLCAFLRTGDKDCLRILKKLELWFLRRYDIRHASAMIHHDAALAAGAREERTWLTWQTSSMYAAVLCALVAPFVVATLLYDRAPRFFDLLCSAEVMVVDLVAIWFLAYRFCWKRDLTFFHASVPRIGAGIIVGYLPVFLIDEVWDLARRSTWVVVALTMLLGLVTLLYIYVEVQRQLGDVTIAFRRASTIFLLGVVQAAGVGLVMTGLVGRFMVSRNWSPGNTELPVEALRVELDPMLGALPHILGRDPFYVFPAVLLLMTFLSFFIGVFLQLMWEELPITEPL